MASPWSVVEGNDPDLLRRIRDPGVGLALWRRVQPRPLAEWLRSTPLHRLPHGRVLVGRDRIVRALETIVRPNPEPAARLLLTDMSDLVDRFCDIADTTLVDIRLEALSHDGCWKFHTDNVALRLIATYRGPGTQWVAAADSERALSEQRRYAGAVQDIPNHAAALFRGTAGGSGEAVVHRSPPIAKAGKSRLVLVLNLPSAASPPETHVEDENLVR